MKGKVECHGPFERGDEFMYLKRKSEVQDDAYVARTDNLQIESLAVRSQTSEGEEDSGINKAQCTRHQRGL